MNPYRVNIATSTCKLDFLFPLSFWVLPSAKVESESMFGSEITIFERSVSPIKVNASFSYCLFISCRILTPSSLPSSLLAVVVSFYRFLAGRAFKVELSFVDNGEVRGGERYRCWIYRIGWTHEGQKLQRTCCHEVHRAWLKGFSSKNLYVCV